MTIFFAEGFDAYLPDHGDNVVNFPRHRIYRCPPGEARCIEGRCMICEGGLSSCTRCHGAEASLPTDCPGHPISHGVLDDIAAGLRDYRWREGWVLLSESSGSRR